MKIQHLIPILFLAAICTVSAQTNTPNTNSVTFTGWVDTSPTPSMIILTTNQAESVAIHLANDKAATLYHSQPFVAGQQAQFVAGHWLWAATQGFGHGDIQAKVELASDGSTNSVNLEFLDNRIIIP